MERERRRSGGGQQGGGTNTSGIRSGVILNSWPSFKIRGSSITAWRGHGGNRGGPAEPKRNATFGMPLVFLLEEAGVPSASPPLYSPPPASVLILKLLKLFPLI